MFCPNCGQEIRSQTGICEHCGTAVSVPAGVTPPGIYAGEDGAYRWVYEINLWKRNIHIGSLLKVLLILLLILIPLVFFMRLDDGFQEALIALLQVLPVAALVMGASLLIGYLITAIINKGKYCAVFTMEKDQITHAQSRQQIEKGRILALISTAVTRDITSGLPALASEKFRSKYSDVKKVILKPQQNLIRLNETLVKNQIYASPEQFSFVADYLCSRCVNAVIKK